jgi:hypothetical protein
VSGPGFRRRVLIRPQPGTVTAWLEDDWHRMAVTLHHKDGLVIQAVAVMERAPWTTCPGALERLSASFAGVPLAEAARVRGKTANCTHLFDLAILAAAHADEVRATAYDVEVSDPEGARQAATLRRDGLIVLEWELTADRLSGPGAIAGRRLTELGDWVAGLDGASQEAARLLRWATIMSAGRQMEIAAHSSAVRFASGTCFTFQPDRAGQATRVPDAHQDFSLAGRGPLADTSAFFTRG